MPKTVLSVAQPPVRNGLNNLATSLVALVATAFLFLALALPARSAPPVEPAPSFPVGNLTALPAIVQSANKALLKWSTTLPENANPANYTFFIRQKVFLPTLAQWELANVASSGEIVSPAPINPNGSRFELWAVKSGSPPTSYLLDTTAAASYLPMATVEIVTEDPYSIVPRTRADRPFTVRATVNGLLSDPGAPESSKSVKLFQHVQSYSATGTGDPLDRTQATLLSQAPITTNGTTSFAFTLNSVPGVNRAKVRGEETFTIFTEPSYELPSSPLDSRILQIWPVAEGSISGLTSGQVLGSSVPQLTLQVNDLYPSSTTRAQVYKGSPQLGATGTTIPGSSVTLNGSVPANRTIVLNNYSALFNSNGLWTMELLTQTPFGTDRLAYVSFTVQRTPMTISEWRQFHFGTPSSTGDGADNNDFDHDGIANLIEFAFGLDPKQSNAGQQLPVPERTGDQLALRFTPSANITGIRYGAEWSTTLQPNSWTPLDNTGIPPEQLFTLPIAGEPSLYLRLTAEQP